MSENKQSIRIPGAFIAEIARNPDESEFEYTSYGGNVLKATKIAWKDNENNSGVSYDFVYKEEN